jgi:hypothetical protein
LPFVIVKSHLLWITRTDHLYPRLRHKPEDGYKLNDDK